MRSPRPPDLAFSADPADGRGAEPPQAMLPDPPAPPTAPAPVPGGWHQVRAMLLWAGLAFFAGLMCVTAYPRLLGGQSYAVLSDSMSPAVRTGDEIMVVPRRVTDLKPGEIAVFDDPAGTGRLLNHRVQRISLEGDRVQVITKGDANTAVERWSVGPDAEVGEVVARIPKLGYLLGRLDPRLTFLLLFGVPATLLTISLLVSIIRAPLGERPGSA